MREEPFWVSFRLSTGQLTGQFIWAFSVAEAENLFASYYPEGELLSVELDYNY